MKPADTKTAEKAKDQPAHDPKTGEVLTGAATQQTAGQQVANQQPGGAVAVFDYSEDAGAGFEGADKSDFIVPVLDILQAGSPECVGGTLEGAKPGNFIIRALSEVFDGKVGLRFVPCARDHVMNEWVPREKGGGLANVFDPKAPDMIKLKEKTPFGKIKLENGNDLVETFYLFGFIITPDGREIRCSVPFWSTKINAYRSFMTKADGITAPPSKPGGPRQKMPLFGHSYRLTSRFVEKKTYKWWGYADILFDGASAEAARIDPMSPLYSEARDFSKQCKEGKVKADMSGVQDTGDDAPAGVGGQGPGGGDTTVGAEGRPF